MGGLSMWHLLVFLVVVLLVFGTGRISTLMGDVAKGIKAFKKGMAEDDGPHPDEPKVLIGEAREQPLSETDRNGSAKR